jgi:hypothetical protein
MILIYTIKRKRNLRAGIMIVNYDRTVITIINYDHKTFIVLATGAGTINILHLS